MAGLEKIDESKRDTHSGGGEKKSRKQGADADSTERSDVPHFEGSQNNRRKNQRHDDHENDPQKNPAGWLDDLIDPPIQGGLCGFGKERPGRKSESQSNDQTAKDARGLRAGVRAAGHR